MPNIIRTVAAALLVGTMLPAHAGVITDRRQVIVDPATSRATLIESGWLEIEGPGGIIGFRGGSRSLNQVHLGGQFELVTTTYLYSEDWLGRPLATPIQQDWYSFENLVLTGLEGLPELTLSINAWPHGGPGQIYGSGSLCERPLPPWTTALCIENGDFLSVKEWVRGTLANEGITLNGQLKAAGGKPGMTKRYYDLELSGNFIDAKSNSQAVPTPATLALLLAVLPSVGGLRTMRLLAAKRRGQVSRCSFRRR
ncbi:MAG: hypothetical protein N838_33055 [Thiohalocapsa sp. PB-PSB1]|jgi:hypothetical protein|nr:MAG: hypothetical protein N838_33055 [Thiohalocapsa sp. PB-PSB1]HCS90925.1 hypothetical protein [Chromatiaceae bacterium]